MFKPTNSSALTQPHGINVSASNYGKAVRLIYGICQATPDLVWYNDWQRSHHPSNQVLQAVIGQHGEKGKLSKKGGQTYYSAAIDLLLGHAPLRGVLSAWYNNQKLAVLQSSSSGVISGGAFTFTPRGGASHTTFIGTIPSVGPYQITVPNFVSDENDVKANGVKLQPATPTPGAGQYTVTTGGLYTFNVAQAGDSVHINYRETNAGAPVTLVSIFAVTLAETFSASFDDFGAPGAVTVYGTWDRPLWNATFGVPGRVDAGAFRARDPYTWWWDGVNPTVNVPAALEGMPVTVYYGVPAIFKSDGSFYSSTLTPLEVLNLEFEQEFASGAEYTNHPDQQIKQSWVCGLGSTRFDLGTANAIPQLNLETIGTFTQWPNGDADVADIVADIVASGPVLV
jgi:hypothetical protein